MSKPESFPTIHHKTLNAILIPKECDSHFQFRGIKYARVPARFEHSIPVDDWEGRTLNCRDFGPKCPQPYRDMRQVFCVPSEQALPPPILEDELECLNLVVSVPIQVLKKPNKRVPVLVYLHGGGHSYTMVNIEQGFTDSTDLIKKSLTLHKPIIMVHIAYRLNLFGYTAFKDEVNFGFHDQKRGIEWVKKYISDFGGDPNNITVSGESAGAIAVHAHIHGPSPTLGIKRAIIQSGSLYLTPPQPRRAGETVMRKLAELTGADDLQTLPPEKLVDGLGQMGFKNCWLHEEDCFVPGAGGEEWGISDKSEVTDIMVGDCKYESRGYERNIISLGIEKLRDLFQSRYPETGAEILNAYDINLGSMDTARPRISAFLNDIKFAFGTDEIYRLEQNARKRRCFRYAMDQPNPWDESAGAHHALDLLFLFGGPFDYSSDETAVKVSEDMREKWVAFMYGEAPWDEKLVYAWGPEGEYGPVPEGHLKDRRRVACFEAIRKIGWARLQPLVARLVEARGVVEEAY